MGLAIRSAIEEGVEEYDMLPGDEQYKFLWTRGARELGRVELYPLRLRGAVCKATVGLSRTAGRFPSVSDGLLDLVGSLLVVSMYQMPGFPRYGLSDIRKPEP